MQGPTPTTLPSKLLHGLATELMNAFMTSMEASLRSKHIAYSMTAVSQGSTILPSSPPAKPNSSWDIIRSSLKIDVPRYARGTSNRDPSMVYTMQWPFIATDGDVAQHSSLDTPFAAVVVRV